MAAFRAELQKAHRRHDLALCLLLPGIVVLWVGGLAPADPEELANGYSALLYSLPVIEAILMPVMMAVLASRLWDMEIKGNTAKLLYTLQSRRSLFAGKAVLEIMRTYFRVSPLQHKGFFLPISRLPLIPSFISPFGVFCHSLFTPHSLSP